MFEDTVRQVGSPAGPPGDALSEASADETMVTTQAWACGSSIEGALHASGADAGRYVERGVIARGGMGEIALCVERPRRRMLRRRALPPGWPWPRICCVAAPAGPDA